MKGMTAYQKVEKAVIAAYSANTPIIYLLTDEMEIADELVNSECTVMLRHYYPAQKEFCAIDEFFEQEGIERNHSSIEKYADNYIVQTSSFEFPVAKKNDVEQIGVFKHYNLSVSLSNHLCEYVHHYTTGQEDSPIRNSLMLLVAPVLAIPEGLEPYVEVIAVPALQDWEIQSIIADYVRFRGKGEHLPNEAYMGKLTEAFRGFSKQKILELLRKIYNEAGFLSGNLRTRNRKRYEQPEFVAFDFIKREKEQMLKKSGVLSVLDTGNTEVGGLSKLIGWLSVNRKLLENPERTAKWRIKFPKGILISGIPGSGKTLMAKKTAEIFNIPLIKMDIGSLMGENLGKSERNMRSALRMAEAMSPCVLFIDELEKSFAGVKGDGNGDSGTLRRCFAHFLSWMQDNETRCFIFATANNISNLPPEFLRRGRFDQKFYVFMPLKAECIEIFKAVIARVDTVIDERGEKKSCGLFDHDITSDSYLGKVVDLCVQDGRQKFLTGADIEGIVNDAMINVYIKSFDSQGGQDGCYKKHAFWEALSEVIRDTQTYGETNMTDIARCYINLAENEFKPASDDSRVLIPFSRFHKDSDPAIELLPSAGTYDELLFNAVSAEVNRQVKEERNDKAARQKYVDENS